jgi:hypothetical protein
MVRSKTLYRLGVVVSAGFWRFLLSAPQIRLDYE